MSPESIVAGSEKLIGRFGKWPSFHDSEVVSLTMERSSRACEFVISVWSYTGKIAPAGHYEQQLHSLVRFRCENVIDNQFSGFNHQNVLWDLEFAKTGDLEATVEVNFPSSYGLQGRLTCQRVCIVDVVPNATNRSAGNGPPL